MEIMEKLPKSTRKFIRLQKALIRKRFLSFEKQREEIANLYNKASKPLAAGKEENKEPVKEVSKKTVKKPKIKNKKSKRIK